MRVGERSISQGKRPSESNLEMQSRAGSMILGELESRARRRGRRRGSAAGERRSGESVRVWSWSRADLAAETSWECFRQATFLMILSREGPRTRPHWDGPPRVCCEAPPDILLLLLLDSIS